MEMTRPGTAAAPARVRVPFRWSLTRGIERNSLLLIVIAVAACAWMVLAVTHSHHSLISPTQMGLSPGIERSPSGHVHGSTLSTEGSLALLTPVVLALAGWMIMVVAMMLPPALPVLQMVRTLTARRWDGAQNRLTYVAAVTFVAVWSLVGVVLVAGNLGVHALWAGTSWAAASPHVISGAVIAGAGLYQLSPLKNACLRACRSPRSFALAHWRGVRSAQAEVAAISGAYALACVGCCWALMLVCFAVGTAALPVMVALTVLMSAERLMPWGRRLVWPTGLLLLLLGASMMLNLAPTHLVTL